MTGLRNPALLRELATHFMAIDRMQSAEDLIRRALSEEAKDGNVILEVYISIVNSDIPFCLNRGNVC